MRPLSRKNDLFAVPKGLFLAIWLFAATAQAHYVIPYELRIGEGTDQKLYTVLVILPDRFANHFGEPDGLSGLMAENFHVDSDVFLNKYLMLPYNWYLDQIPRLTRVYGADAQKIADGLRQFESMGDGRSSAVVITEHHQLDKILAFLRVDTGDADGLLASDRHFLHKGLDGMAFPKPAEDFTWRSVVNFKPESYQKDFHKLVIPTAERPHFWYTGENVELKNFGMDPATFQKFFKYLYLIGRSHKMFDWGGSLFPKKLKTWPDGTPLPKDAHLRFGRRISHVWLDAYSEILMRFYSIMGFKVWKVINNEHTFGRDLYFMYGAVEEIEQRLTANLKNQPSSEQGWLVRSEELSVKFETATCTEDVIQYAKPVPKLKKRRRTKK